MATKKTKLETVAVTVNETHYDNAMKALAKNSYSVLTQCLVAQAVKAAFPGKTVTVGFDDAEVGTGKGKRKFDMNKKASSLVTKFDNSELDPKKHLPAVIKLKEIPASRWTI
jgi:hypothetical protein